MNYVEFYKSIEHNFADERSRKVICAIDKSLVIIYAIAYFLLLGIMIFTSSPFLFKCIAIPGLTFVTSSLLRVIINRARPYEAHEINPIISKTTKGKSMPSRHMTSAIIITFSYLLLFTPVSYALFLGCICIAFTRIVGGVHYPTDILCATILGLVFGYAGFFLF